MPLYTYGARIQVEAPTKACADALVSDALVQREEPADDSVGCFVDYDHPTIVGGEDE